MKNYLTIHYNGTTSLTYTHTEAEARQHLCALLKTGQASKYDSMGIVRLADDYAIYYRRKNNTVDRLLAPSFLGWIKSKLHSMLGPKNASHLSVTS